MKRLEELQAFYENEGEEELRLMEEGPHYLEFLTATRYLNRYLLPSSRILDHCAGSGAYAFYLARQGHQVTAGDVVPYNVDCIREKQQQQPLLTDIYCGDALNLSRFADHSFDAVLCMGALYHLDKPQDRHQAVSESLRVLRPGGVFACTYMNRYGVILNDASGSLDNLDDILRFLAEGTEGIFYASTPEETQALMEEFGLEPLCHVALDGVSNLLHRTAGLLDDTGMKRWREVHQQSCEVPSLLGASYHNLYMGRLVG